MEMFSKALYENNMEAIKKQNKNTSKREPIFQDKNFYPI